MKPATPSRLVGVLLGLLILASACQNAGAGRVTGIAATGIVNGLVYLDRNGNGILDGADTALVNLSVRLVAQGTRDTVATGKSSASGTLHFVALPVGSYAVVVDTTTTLGDSLRVTRIDSAALTLRPDDTLNVRIGVSFPQLSIAQARSAAPGRKMFLVGVALDTRGIFGDTTVNLADSVAAIRLTAVRTTTVAAGDSIRVFGTRSSRDGQPTLNQVTAFTLAFDAQTPIHSISSVVAAAADSGRLDAALVQVRNAAVTDTATVQGTAPYRRLMVNDGSGVLEVRLDSLVGFRTALLAGDTIGAKLDIAGLLLPVGPGTWRLKPRAPSDVIGH